MKAGAKALLKEQVEAVAILIFFIWKQKRKWLFVFIENGRGGSFLINLEAVVEAAKVCQLLLFLVFVIICDSYAPAKGIRLNTYHSQKPGRDRVAWTALRGSACKRALEVMGDAFITSVGVFKDDVKVEIGKIWNKTRE